MKRFFPGLCAPDAQSPGKAVDRRGISPAGETQKARKKICFGFAYFIPLKNIERNLTGFISLIYTEGGRYMSAILYTVKEVSALIHTNPSYVYELIRRGFLPAMKLGSYKVRAESLEKFLADSEGKDLTDLDDVKDLPK